MNTNKFSVLIPVYYKDNPEHFKIALSSIINQTLPPSEIVVVKDGPLTDQLENIISLMEKKYVSLFKIRSLSCNSGLGIALAEGLTHCSYDIVARMDADDISKSERFYKQMTVMTKNPSIDVVGSWMDEFYDQVDNIVSQKKVPATTKEIISYAKKRNPLNHPTVMFRKKAVIDSGNYQCFLWVEDYILWVKMLINGSQMSNIQESLLLYRADDSMFKRRGGWKYVKCDIMLQRELLQLGFISQKQCYSNIVFRLIVRIMPNNFRLKIYKIFLRNRHEGRFKKGGN